MAAHRIFQPFAKFTIDAEECELQGSEDPAYLIGITEVVESEKVRVVAGVRVPDYLRAYGVPRCTLVNSQMLLTR